MSGLKSVTLQRKLLSEISLTFNRACIIAQTSETVKKEARMLANNDEPQDVHYVRNSKSHNQTSTHSANHANYGHGHKHHEKTQKSSYNEKGKKCYRCGRTEMCPAMGSYIKSVQNFA